MLSAPCPLVSFREKSETAYEKLLEAVRKRLPAAETEEASLTTMTRKKKDADAEKKKEQSYQVMYQML